jgi:hypothetical protein
MTLTARPSAFLRLPREIRYEIYDHLCRPEPKSYPFGKSPITSIDQRAPPIELFVSCRYLYEEIQSYFYARVTFRFMAKGIFSPTRKNIHKNTLNALKQAKKIEFRLEWLFSDERAESAAVMDRRLAEHVDLLLDEAENLEMITVSVFDISDGVEWNLKQKVLTPLERMAGKVRFRMGEAAATGEEEEELRERLGEYLKGLNTVALSTPCSLGHALY